MIKKLLVLSLLIFCFSPTFAQWGKAAKAGAKAWRDATAATEAALRRQVAGQTVGVSKAMAVQITNLPGQPLVKLGTALSSLNGQDNVPSVLPARMMSGTENHTVLFPKPRLFSPMYIPIALNTTQEVAYRGVTLYNLQSLQNILENGLEYDRVSPVMDNKIYFSGHIYRAAKFATQSDSPYGELPVLIKFALPESRNDIYAHNYLYGLDYYFFVHNIGADYLLDVMVLLEVNGVPGWYKATLEEGNLVFTPTPSRIFDEKELIKHDIKIPQGHIQDDW